MCGTHRTITKLIDYYEFCGVRGEEAPGPTVQVPEITPRELKARLDRGDDLFILDVREPHEYQICNLNGHLLPLGDLTRRVHELDSSREIVANSRKYVIDFRHPSAPTAKGLDMLLICAILNHIDNHVWSAGACSRFSFLRQAIRAFASPKQPKSHPLESTTYEMQFL